MPAMAQRRCPNLVKAPKSPAQPKLLEPFELNQDEPDDVLFKQAREGVKIEHEKKLKTLQNQEYKGEDETKLDKTKTSIKKLQSLIIVTSQAVNTTSSAIVGLRDSDLVPLLVELCHGFMYMWRSMNQSHEFHNQIVQQVRGLVNQAAKGYSTSELHRQATRDLESVVSTWHSSFCRLVKHQRDFICSLHGWFEMLDFLPSKLSIWGCFPVVVICCV